VGCIRACLERDQGQWMPRLVEAPLAAWVPAPRARVLSHAYMNDN
jgi:hypothetical protein